MMRVAIVSSWPPERCGVADGVALLSVGLAELGVEVVPVSAATRDPLALRRAILAAGADVVHHEFPTMHHAHNLALYAAPLLHWRPTVVTLHEFTRLTPRGRLQALLPALAGHIVFPTRAERHAASRWAPWAAAKMHYVPISSNVPRHPGSGVSDGSRVAFFGLLGTGRGIEEFLHLAQLARGSGLRFTLIGEEHRGQEEYGAAIRRQAAVLDVELVLDRPLGEVARALAGSAFAYLPFPLGAAENRGTLMACLTNGCIALTTRGRQTPPELSPAVEFVTGPTNALEAIQRLRADPGRQAQLRAAVPAYLQKYTWSVVAEGYRRVYQIAAGAPLVGATE